MEEEDNIKLPKVNFNVKTELPKGKNWIFKIIDWGLIILLIIVMLSLLHQKAYCKTDPIICKGDVCQIATCEGGETKWTQTPTTQEKNQLNLDFFKNAKSGNS